MTKFNWVRRTELDVEEQRKVQARRLQRHRPAVNVLRLFMNRVAKFFKRIIDAFADLAERVGAVVRATLPHVEPVVRTSLHQRLAGDITALIAKQQATGAPSFGLPTLSIPELPPLAIPQLGASSGSR